MRSAWYRYNDTEIGFPVKRTAYAVFIVDVISNLITNWVSCIICEFLAPRIWLSVIFSYSLRLRQKAKPNQLLLWARTVQRATCKSKLRIMLLVNVQRANGFGVHTKPLVPFVSCESVNRVFVCEKCISGGNATYKFALTLCVHYAMPLKWLSLVSCKNGFLFSVKKTLQKWVCDAHTNYLFIRTFLMDFSFFFAFFFLFISLHDNLYHSIAASHI